MENKSKSKDVVPFDFDKKEIDAVINKIILKNKVKLEDTHNKEKEISRFSVVSDQKNKLYYVKQKQKKKKKNELFSGEIINDARKNLGKKPQKINPIDKDTSDEEYEKTVKKIRLKFGKKDKKENEKPNIDSSTEEKIDNLGKDKKYEEIVDEVDKKLNLKESTKPKENSLKDEINRSTEEPKEFICKPFNLSKEKKKPSEKPKNKVEQTKNSFFKFFPSLKSKKEKKSSELEKKELDTKKPELDEDFVPPAPQVNKPTFRVENFPRSKNQEKKLIEKNIEKFQNKKSDENEKKFEERALDLASEHLKKIENKPDGTADNKTKNQPVQSSSLNIGKSSKHEHVFFDEESSFPGWSPHVVEKEKDLSGNFTDKIHGDVDLDEYGEVKNVELPKDSLKVDSVKLSDLGFSENDWQELDFYSLHEPFAFVEVLREKETLEKRYFLVEVEMSKEEQKTLDFIYETIFNMGIETETLEKRGEDDYLANQIEKVVKEYNLEINETSFEKIIYFMSKNHLGFNKIDPLLKDPNIEDISCDGAGVPIFLYHRKYGSLKSNIQFNDEEELSSFVFRLAQKCGKHISIANPMVDATMPDGSRIQMTLSDEITAHGSTFTIRKFRSDPFSPPDLVEFNTMSSEMIAYMWLAVENGVNMLFAGGTASGKTSALNALSLFIPPESKIVSIEETREINLPHPNWIPGVARSGFGSESSASDDGVGSIDMYDLMKAALRQRPEYIIVGEIRGREAYVLFQAMATGHATYSTVHADSAQSLIHRLEGKPINIPRVMLQSLDVVSLHIITKVNNKRARRCKQVIEIIDIDPTTKEILTNEAFRWDPVEDKFLYSGKSYVLERIRAEKDLSRDQITNELNQRKKLIDYMNENNLRGFREVAHNVSRYLDNPGEIFAKINKESK